MVRLLQDLNVRWVGEIYVKHKELHSSSSLQLKQRGPECLSRVTAETKKKKQQSCTLNQSY